LLKRDGVLYKLARRPMLLPCTRYPPIRRTDCGVSPI
jgi:hypothetical protein